jgi:4-diphosphocytidyl-2-C-methyl-D-erythritol kinase
VALAQELASRVEAAPAKINLALHVTGRRADGYHLLDSLVAFAAVADGDRVSVSFGAPGPQGPRLAVSGPFAPAVPAGGDNIVLAAARACGGIAAVHLHKGLPVAAGIGGGSADAAAVLRAFAAHGGIDPGALAEAALALGADVPVCLSGRSCRMEGIGERLTPVTLPQVPVLLVNCGRPVGTAEVFAGLSRRDNAPLPPLPSVGSARALADYLAQTRNDLEPVAERLVPEVAEVRRALVACPGALFARMSGSGATVFALFADTAARDAAATRLAGAPGAGGWWIRSATLGGADGG